MYIYYDTIFCSKVDFLYVRLLQLRKLRFPFRISMDESHILIQCNDQTITMPKRQQSLCGDFTLTRRVRRDRSSNVLWRLVEMVLRWGDEIDRSTYERQQLSPTVVEGPFTLRIHADPRVCTDRRVSARSVDALKPRVTDNDDDAALSSRWLTESSLQIIS